MQSYLYNISQCFLGIYYTVASPKGTLKGPAFNNAYTVKGTLYIPYAEIREPFYAWYDGTSGSSRIDYYGGTSLIYFASIFRV